MTSVLESVFQIIPLGIAFALFLLAVLYFMKSLGHIWDLFFYEESLKKLKRALFECFFAVGITVLVAQLALAEPALTVVQGLVFVVLGVLVRLALRLFRRKAL